MWSWAWNYGCYKPHKGYLALTFAFLCRLGFNGLLRPGEIASLRCRHLLFTSDIMTSGEVLVICLTQPKTRRKFARRQFVTIEDKETVNWAQWFTRSLNPDDMLWPSTQAKFRSWFRKCCKRLGLPSGLFTPASLRSGGATHLFLKQIPLDRIRLLGRWTSQSSLEIYVQESLSRLVLQQLSNDCKLSIRLLANQGAFLWTAPPYVELQRPHHAGTSADPAVMSSCGET